MTIQNALPATEDSRPGLIKILATLETEILAMCALADAALIVQNALPCLNGNESLYEKRAFHTLDSVLGLLSERASFVYEVSAQAALIAANPTRAPE